MISFFTTWLIPPCNSFFLCFCPLSHGTHVTGITGIRTMKYGCLSFHEVGTIAYLFHSRLYAPPEGPLYYSSTKSCLLVLNWFFYPFTVITVSPSEGVWRLYSLSHSLCPLVIVDTHNTSHLSFHLLPTLFFVLFTVLYLAPVGICLLTW